MGRSQTRNHAINTLLNTRGAFMEPIAQTRRQYLRNASDPIQRNQNYNNNTRRNTELLANPVRQTNGNLPTQHRRLRNLRDDHRANRRHTMENLPIPPLQPYIIRPRPQRTAQPRAVSGYAYPPQDAHAEHMFAQELRHGNLNNVNYARVYRTPTNLRVNNVGILPTGQENIPPRNTNGIFNLPGPPTERQHRVTREEILTQPLMQQGPNVDAAINNRQRIIQFTPPPPGDMDIYRGGTHHQKKGKKTRRRKSNKK